MMRVKVFAQWYAYDCRWKVVLENWNNCRW